MSFYSASFSPWKAESSDFLIKIGAKLIKICDFPNTFLLFSVKGIAMQGCASSRPALIQLMGNQIFISWSASHIDLMYKLGGVHGIPRDDFVEDRHCRIID